MSNAHYPILKHGNILEQVKGSILKLGKGKKSTSVLGVRALDSPFSPWRIDHIPSGRNISHDYNFQSTAKLLAQSILEVMGTLLLMDSPEKLASNFPSGLLMYLEYYRFKDIKRPMTYGDFIISPEYESLIIPSGQFSSNQEREDEAQLLEGDSTLGWVPTWLGRGFEATELRGLVEGYDSGCSTILVEPSK